jgi:hypothetical protein
MHLYTNSLAKREMCGMMKCYMLGTVFFGRFYNFRGGVDLDDGGGSR